MARKPHKYHYIYKRVCVITNKYYIGMHSTSNLEDRYKGSGKKLGRSLNKYGDENHTFEILEFLDDRESLKKREKEIVNEELIQDPLCMNMQLGGGGGFSSKEHFDNFVKRCKNNGSYHKMKCQNDEDFKKKTIENWNKNRASFIGENNGFFNKKHSDETKKKISESNSISQLGEKNSQFGTCWINDGVTNKKIKKSDLESHLIGDWKLGRIIKVH